jgi:hypothetical protein
MCRPPFTPRKIPGTHSYLLEAETTPWPSVRLEGLGPLKNPITSSGIEPATFRLVTPQSTTLPKSYSFPPPFRTSYTMHIVSSMSVTTDGFLIDGSVYCIRYTTLHYTLRHCYTTH